MNLAIDIGNSAVKSGIFKEGRLIQIIRFNHFNPQKIHQIVLKNKIHNMIVSTVKGKAIKRSKRIKKSLDYWLTFSTETPVPITNLYQTPFTLGKDRLAAVTGANNIFPNENVLVIDAGTAITFDFINSKGEFMGGNISPGLSMRFRALHEFTQQLPLLSQEEDTGLLGMDTEKSIRRGVQNGMIFEINQYIKDLSVQYGKVKTILTGGNSNFFDNKLNCPIFVEPDLVLKGLNRILKYNIYER